MMTHSGRNVRALDDLAEDAPSERPVQVLSSNVCLVVLVH